MITQTNLSPQHLPATAYSDIDSGGAVLLAAVQTDQTRQKDLNDRLAFEEAIGSNKLEKLKKSLLEIAGNTLASGIFRGVLGLASAGLGLLADKTNLPTLKATDRAFTAISAFDPYSCKNASLQATTRTDEAEISKQQSRQGRVENELATAKRQQNTVLQLVDQLLQVAQRVWQAILQPR